MNSEIPTLTMGLLKEQKQNELHRLEVLLKQYNPDAYKQPEIIASPFHTYETLNLNNIRLFIENGPIERRINDEYTYHMCKNQEFLLCKFENEPITYLSHKIVYTKNSRVVNKIIELMTKDLEDLKYTYLPFYIKILVHQEAVDKIILDLCIKCLKFLNFGLLYVLIAMQWKVDKELVQNIFTQWIMKKFTDTKVIMSYFRGLDLIFEDMTNKQEILEQLNNIPGSLPKSMDVARILNYSLILHQILFKFFAKRQDDILPFLNERLRLYYLSSKAIMDTKYVHENVEPTIINLIPLAHLASKFPSDLKWIAPHIVKILGDLPLLKNSEVLKAVPLLMSALVSIFTENNEMILYGDILENILNLKKAFLKQKVLFYKVIADHYIQMLLKIYNLKNAISVLYILSFASYFNANMTLILDKNHPKIPLAHLNGSWVERTFFYLHLMTQEYFDEDYYPFVFKSLGNPSKLIFVKAAQVFLKHKSDEHMLYFVEKCKTNLVLFEYLIKHFPLFVLNCRISVSIIENFLFAEFKKKKYKSRPIFNAIAGCTLALQVSLLQWYFESILIPSLTESSNRTQFKQVLFDTINNSNDYTRKNVLVSLYLQHVENL